MKRAPLPFDIKHFEKLKKSGRGLTTEEIFKEIYSSNHWQGEASLSGQGSGVDQTREISIQIPKLIHELGVKRVLDVPCGDFNWFSKMDMELNFYIGGDIIDEIVERNHSIYQNQFRYFQKIDLIKDPLPESDILLCRDCLVHFSNNDILEALKNIKKSNITFLLTTTFTDCLKNKDIVTGDWRIINLGKPPFNLPTPLKLINEKCTEGNGTYADKCLGLWNIRDL